MPLLPYEAPPGELSWDSALVQITMIKRIYEVDVFDLAVEMRAVVPDIILVASKNTLPSYGGGGDVQPKYAMWRSNSQYWYTIYGTWTYRQWAANALSGLNQSPLPNGQKAGSVWLEMAELMMITFESAAIPGDEAVNLAGHSLGGACAFLLGALIKRAYPERTVRVMTFGCPRPMLGTYTGTKPDVHWDIQIAGDPITKLPPNTGLSPTPHWMLQGTPRVITAEGIVIGGDFNAGEHGLRDFDTAAFERHYSQTYFAYINRRRELNPPSPPVVLTLLAATQAIAGEAILPILQTQRNEGYDPGSLAPLEPQSLRGDDPPARPNAPYDPPPLGDRPVRLSPATAPGTC